MTKIIRKINRMLGGSSYKGGMRRKHRVWFRRVLWLMSALVLLGIFYVIYLDFTVRAHFEGKRWEIPSKVYARPLELFAEKDITTDQLLDEITALRYQRVVRVVRPGEYSRTGDRVDIYTRGFEFHDGSEAPRHLLMRFSANRLIELRDVETESEATIVRLEPIAIGGIYPRIKEDRILIRIKDTPELLIKTLIAVEDRDFYQHKGIAPTAILRAFIANIRAGGVVQGGSTLTQQLVKNFYLSEKKSLWRKANEAIMALQLEWHYEKNDILEAYFNEIFLAQQGARAIHGFGLGSQYYFAKPLEELNTAEIALLVGIVKGPSFYDPRRHPQRARERRNVVLKVLAEQGIISDLSLARALKQDLGIARNQPGGISPYPGFMELVQRQLHRDYQEQDLETSGLHIYTSLDPFVQKQIQSAMTKHIARLENQRRFEPGFLQGAGIVSDSNTGEIIALSGDRYQGAAGFNRALDAKRPVGSLLKPFVYLTALSQPSDYHMATLIDDSPMDWTLTDWKDWAPKNYDAQSHGPVPLYQALANSYNLATIRLGMQLGLENIIETLHLAGIERDIPALPSLILGAIELSPYETIQAYQVLASGGFYSELKAIRAVTNNQGELIQRFPLEIKQVFKPAPVYLLNQILAHAMKTGTGKRAYRLLPEDFHVAGKTGTTDDLRDSWFAGFSGDRLAVLWVGNDDNQPAGLTGSSGALEIWSELMATVAYQSLELNPSEDVSTVYVDPETGELSNKSCAEAIEIHVIEGYDWMQSNQPCESNRTVKKIRDKIERIRQWLN